MGCVGGWRSGCGGESCSPEAGCTARPSDSGGDGAVVRRDRDEEPGPSSYFEWEAEEVDQRVRALGGLCLGRRCGLPGGGHGWPMLCVKSRSHCGEGRLE